MASDPDLVGTLVADRFRMIRRIGGGSFGEIYMGMGPNLTEVSDLKTDCANSEENSADVSSQ